MPSAEGGHLDGVASDRHDLVLAELQRLAGVLDERRHITTEEVLAFADPHDQRRVAASGDDPRRILGIDGHEREGTLEPLADPLHRRGQIVSGKHLALQQMRRYLGVRLGQEFVTLCLELGPKLRKVLDDAVVDERDPLGRPQVWVGVGVGRRAVGRPASVADGGGAARQRRLEDRLLKVGQLAGALVGSDRALVHQRDARGVIAAVLHAPKALDDDALGALVAHIADDSAQEGESSDGDRRPVAAEAPPTHDVIRTEPSKPPSV